MGEQAPALLREELHQLALDLLGIGLSTEAEQFAQPGDMGIDRHSFVDLVGISQNDVGGLPPYAGEPAKFLHGPRYFAAVVGHESLSHADQAPGLVPKESG